MESSFDNDMKAIYLTAQKELKYNASRFWQLFVIKVEYKLQKF